MCRERAQWGREEMDREGKKRGECGGERQTMPPGDGIYSSLYCVELSITDVSVLHP